MDNEYELILMGQEENEDAIDMLYKRYKRVMKTKCLYAYRIMKNYGVDINDLMQEAYLGFDYAIKNYLQSNEASFLTFASICIDSKITNFCRFYTGIRHSVLNTALQIDSLIESTVMDEIDIEKMVLNDYNDYDYIENIRKELTDLERSVFDLKLYGYKFNDLSVILKKDSKAIYNALQRIKNKIKNYQEMGNYD